MIQNQLTLGGFKVIISTVLLLSSFFASTSLLNIHVGFAQQDSASNLQDTLARQLSEVLNKSAANETQPVSNISSLRTESPDNYFPVVDVQSPITVKQGELVTLNGSASSDPDGSQLNYAWSQDSGTPVVINDDNKPVANFTAPNVSENSVLAFSLLVEDEKGGMGKNTTYVTIQATDKPHANAGEDQTVDEGEWVTLDGEDSYDPNGGSLKYSWTQTGGPNVDLQDTSDPQAHFWSPYVYDDEVLEFTLTVRNEGGNSDEDSVSIQVKTNVDSNDQPHADAGGDQTVNEGEWVTLDGDGSYDPDGEQLDYSWTQTSGPNVDLENDDEEEANFRAPAVNDDTSLTFELRVEDESGRSDEDSVTVNVNENDDYNDDLPCVQTYDTGHGTYVTDCDNTVDNDNPPPVCKQGETGPNCTPAPPVCKQGETGPNCTPATQPETIESRPTTQNTQPETIEPTTKKTLTQQQQSKPSKMTTTSEHKSSAPDTNPPQPPQQKFKSSGSFGSGSGGSGGGLNFRR